MRTGVDTAAVDPDRVRLALQSRCERGLRKPVTENAARRQQAKFVHRVPPQKRAEFLPQRRGWHRYRCVLDGCVLDDSAVGALGCSAANPFIWPEGGGGPR